MDRIKFMQSIIRADRSLTDDIIDYFDHEMLLYELVGYANNTITVTDCTSKNISFNIDGNKRDISTLNNYLRTYTSNPIVEYDKPLVVHYSVISDRSINITISDI